MKIINFLQHARDRIRRAVGIIMFDRARVVSQNDDGPIVMIRWDAKLGDAIVSSWVPREIHRAQPGREIWVVTTSEMAPLFRDHFEVDRVIEVPKRSGYGELKRLANALGHVGYLVHFGKHLKMKDIYFLSQVDASHVAGLDDSLFCIDIKLGQETAGIHFSTKFEVLLKHMGIIAPDTSYIVPSVNEVEKEVGAWWSTHNTICFNPYGSGVARSFSIDKAVELVDTMLRSSKFNICLLYPPDNEKEILLIKSKVCEPTRVIFYQESPSLPALFAQVRNCIGMVSVDTATVHIATGLNKPVLGIYNANFGMEENVEWHPNNHRSSVIYAKARASQQSVNFIDMADFKVAFDKWVSDFL
ncbi:MULTISPECIES: glycosyltransferase family 9 protein [Aeromonas]|uniref:glycosyltransferase family 9 protein n=1 Tax=Aeromonas TaxID=642 RepID=UPI0029761909|nr:glycosyltransferase family 9 protein [Aeromonas rivipollensis]